MSAIPSVVLLGDENCNKTSFVIRYTKDRLSENYEPTLEDNYRVTIKMPNGKNIDVEVVETAGQDDFQSLQDKYIEIGDFFLVLYSVTSSASLQYAREALHSIKSIRGNFKFVLVGNNSESPNRAVTFEDGKKLAAEFNGKFIEASSKTGTNVKEVFQEIGALILGNEDTDEGGCCRI